MNKFGMVAFLTLLSLLVSCSGQKGAGATDANQAVETPHASYWTVINGLSDSFDGCFADDSDASGRATLRWTIQEDGTVKDLRVEDAVDAGDEAAGCLEETLAGATFAEASKPVEKNLRFYSGSYDDFSSYKTGWLEQTFGYENYRARTCFETIPGFDSRKKVVLGWAIRSDGATSGLRLEVEGEVQPLAAKCLVYALDEVYFPVPSETSGWHRYTWCSFDFGWTPASKGEQAKHLSRGEVWEVIQKSSPAIQACYEKELVSKPGLGGKIQFTWLVERDGTVADVEVLHDSMQDGEVARCMQPVIEQMKFPEPDGCDGVKIVFPWIFKPI